MRLLFLSPFPSRPLYGGAVVRNHYLSRSLAGKHRVWASFCGRDGGEQFQGEVPLRREGLPALFDPGFLFRAHRLIKAEKIEAIVSSSLISGLHGALLKLSTGLPFWMDEHNVEWHCARRYGHKLWWLIFLLEGFILRRADHITCVSSEDRDRIHHGFHIPRERITVAPNGVDCASVVKRSPSGGRTHKRILFFGVLDYPPNREAVDILGEFIAPRVSEDVEIVVAGRGGEDLANRFPRLKFPGYVEKIHDLIADCDGVVVPILSGGGTRMKILESVACGRPVVSTARGAEGIELDALGDTITITDDFQQMVEWIENLKVGAAARAPDRFAELYDWEKIWQNRAPL